ILVIVLMKKVLQKIGGHKNFEQWCFALFIACVHLLIFGYRFNSGDQAEHLPQVYQKLDPSLFPNDFFLVNYNQTFTVRFYWVEMVTLFSRMVPVSVVCFSLYFITLVLTVSAWIKIAAYFSDNKTASYLSVFLIFILFNNFTVGGNSIQGNIFISSNSAELFASFGILFFLRKKTIYAALFFALASLFQVLVGFQLWIIFFIVLFFSERKTPWLKTFLFGLVYLSSSLPILFPVIQKQFLANAVYDSSLYYRSVYVFRSYLHFKPSLFPTGDYIKLLLIFLPAVFFTIRNKLIEKRIIIIIFITIIFGALVYTLLLEGFEMNSIGKIQWFKTTVWLNAFCCIILCKWLSEYFSKQAAMFSFNPFYLLLLSILIVLTVSNSRYLPGEKLSHRYQFGNYPKTDLQIVHEWIRNNTSKDAMFLVSPMNDAFACEAQRPQPVNFKAVIHEPFYFALWYKRMQDYYHVNFDKVGNNPALFQAEYNFQHDRSLPPGNIVKYRLDNLKECKFADRLGPAIFQSGNWIVTKIN
ncbi:MAG: DUF6798 domain-containing protein, partial [Bacteroidia bacterium]